MFVKMVDLGLYTNPWNVCKWCQWDTCLGCVWAWGPCDLRTFWFNFNIFYWPTKYRPTKVICFDYLSHIHAEGVIICKRLKTMYEMLEIIVFKTQFNVCTNWELWIKCSTILSYSGHSWIIITSSCLSIRTWWVRYCLFHSI